MQIRLFASSCRDNQFVSDFSGKELLWPLIVKELNDSDGTHKVNGEFSGPGYTHNLSHLFFFLYFLSSFLSSYFSPFQASASSQGFFFRDHWSVSNGISQHQYHQ